LSEKYENCAQINS